MKNIVSIISSKKTLIFISIIFIAIIYMFITKKEIPASEASNASTKCFAYIEIDVGDTLWDIAERYMTEEYKSKQQYIDEVKYINNLDSNQITAGAYLLVPYYEVSSYE